MRTVNEGFEDFLKRLVPTNAQRTAGAGHRSSVKSALESKLSVSRFFESGSFSHGTGVRSYSDIDVFVSLKGARPTDSYSALTRVKDTLAARFPSTIVTIRRPAVVVRFGGGYETWEVIPAFLTGQGGANKELIYDIPGPASGSGWIDAAPDAHIDYVNKYNETPTKGNAKSLARLIKAWKYYNSVPASSFYLEMRSAQHVSRQSTYIHIWDMCLLLESLNAHQLAPMHDPSGATKRFAACSSDTSLILALSKLSTAATRARKALEAHKSGNIDLAFQYLNLLFGGYFPSR